MSKPLRRRESKCASGARQWRRTALFRVASYIVCWGAGVALTLQVEAATTSAAKSVIELQPFATTQSAKSASGQAIRLVNLNADVGAHYILAIGKRRYHLQFPTHSAVELAADGLRFNFPGKATQHCSLAVSGQWTLKRSKKLAFTPICGGRVFVRQALNGWQQKVKAPAEMRATWRAWQGQAHENRSQADSSSAAPRGAGSGSSSRAGAKTPPVAMLNPKHVQTSIWAPELGIKLAPAKKKQRLRVGHWYPAQHFDDVHVSVIKLKHIAPALLKTFRQRVNSLSANDGGPQTGALVHLIAMNLRSYTLNWAHGTDHPGVAWSRRHRLPRSNKHGPDGFAKLAPFVPAAVVSPADLPRTVGTFSAGFQRRHGAFKWGHLSKTADAHHYGFIEDGVVLSKLMPNLATVIGYVDGDVELKTWTAADNKYLHQVRFARQNGVPVMIGGGPDSVGEPGELVGNWGHGNWSGSAKAELRTPRSAACLVEDGGQRWLIYAYFFTHTPSGMARVLQAYACDYSVHLDMNSPGHAYFAMFTRAEPTLDTLDFRIEHLMTQMRGWDPRMNRKPTPRYLLKPEYKDFFYIMRR